MGAPRLLIVGSGRSGTGWMANLLRGCGLRCGHEQVFTLAAGLNPGMGVDWSGWDADASWLAVPRLPLPFPTVAVVRHPLPVVESMVRIGLFDTTCDDPYARVYYRWDPGIRGERAVQDRALRAWLRMTATAVAHADLTVRVEHVDAATLAGVLTLAGRDPAGAAAAITATPDEARNRKLGEKTVDYHSGWHQHRPDLAAQARDLAARLGYHPDLPC